jgi:hypothetical protein
MRAFSPDSTFESRLALVDGIQLAETGLEEINGDFLETD